MTHSFGIVCVLQAKAVKRVKKELNKTVVWKFKLWMVIIILLFAIICVTFFAISLRIGMGLMKLIKRNDGCTVIALLLRNVIYGNMEL